MIKMNDHIAKTPMILWDLTHVIQSLCEGFCLLLVSFYMLQILAFIQYVIPNWVCLRAGSVKHSDKAMVDITSCD